MTNATIDFDAFRRERKALAGDKPEEQGSTFLFGGREWRLPPRIPAAVVLEVVRLRADKGDDEDMAIESLDRVGSSLFGEVQWRELLATPLDDGFPIPPQEIGTLVMVALGATGHKVGDAVPNRKARRAAKSST